LSHRGPAVGRVTFRICTLIAPYTHMDRRLCVGSPRVNTLGPVLGDHPYRPLCHEFFDRMPSQAAIDLWAADLGRRFWQIQRMLRTHLKPV
jgi:hypothetical protein